HVQRQGRALGGRRTLAFAAAGAPAAGRALRTETALQRLARAADGRPALRRRRRDRGAAGTARAGQVAAAAGAVELRAVTTLVAAARAPVPAGHERIALALGAGGARGLAQIGVVEGLEERGLVIDAVSGSSSGALVGGIFAAGRLRAFDERLRSMSRTDFLRLLDPGWRRSGVLRGQRLVDTMREVVGDPLIETLPVEFTAVAVDLERQREVWIREGRRWDGRRASFASPGLFTPHRINGRALVDGGLLAPLPITATRLSDAHRLVAVDMHGWPRRGVSAAPAPAGDALRMGLPEIMSRSLDTMQAQIA